MANFISEHAAQLLNSPRNKQLPVSNIAHTPSYTRGRTQLTLSTLSGQVITHSHQFHILNKMYVD